MARLGLRKRLGFASIPLLALLLGAVPSPANPSAGCRFHTRCPEVFARCRSEAPPFYAQGDGGSRCFLKDPSGTGRRDPVERP